MFVWLIAPNSSYTRNLLGFTIVDSWFIDQLAYIFTFFVCSLWHSVVFFLWPLLKLCLFIRSSLTLILRDHFFHSLFMKLCFILYSVYNYDTRCVIMSYFCSECDYVFPPTPGLLRQRGEVRWGHGRVGGREPGDELPGESQLFFKKKFFFQENVFFLQETFFLKNFFF